ncbi:VOC family protein [Nocardioides speluncae]|uniref:VOC family protein n=1 Tax=Nocardioides speluncae TaxID=2670337 RepID=UPI000D68AD11|nr:VOC family protein [Nocardioides speluncae]
MSSIVPNLWFDTEAEEAARFYVSALGGKIHNVTHYGPGMPRESGVMTVEFEVRGQELTGINGGPEFKFTEAVSLEVQCEDQDDLNQVWDALVDGGEPGPCGWLKDRYGLSWQVTPKSLADMTRRGDNEAFARAMAVVLTTNNQPFDIAAIEAAYAGA